MILDSTFTALNNKKVILLKQDNPFKETTLEFWLIQFLIEKHSTLFNFSTLNFSQEIINFLNEHNQSSIIDCYSANKLDTYALHLGMTHRIIELEDHSSYGKNTNISKFGLFLEDGLINPLKIKKYTNWLPKNTDNKSTNLLWQSLYINNIIRDQLQIPDIDFKSYHYSNNKETIISLKNIHTNGLFELNKLEIPIAPFSLPWHSDDWIKIKSRGLFHHIGDQIGFIIAAAQYGDCYVVGETNLGDLYTLTKSTLSSEKQNRYSVKWELYKQLSKHDFNYIYGVPKGNAFLPATIISQKRDCKINSLDNIDVESFWNNDVFKKYSLRNNFVSSFEDLAHYLINKTKEILTTEQNYNLDLLLNNDLNNFQPIEFTSDQESKILDQCSFFYKTLAHKTHCEVINPISSMDLGFFKKNNGESLTSTYINPIKIIQTYQSFCKTVKFVNIKVNESKALVTNGKSTFNSPVYEDSPAKFIDFFDNISKDYKYNSNKVNHKSFDEFLNFNDSLDNISKNEDEDNEYLSNDNTTYDESLYETFYFNNSINTSSNYEDDEDYNEDTYYYDYEHLSFKEKMKLHEAKNFFKYFTKCIYESLSESYLLPQHIEKSLYKKWFDNNTKCFFVSDVVDLRNEYRTFIIDHKPVATTACFRNTVPLNSWMNGRFDPRLADGHNATDTVINRQRTYLYAKFLRQFTKEMKEKYPNYKNYVLDIAWSDEKKAVVPIEINSINWSGAYQLNMFRLCSAISNKPYKYEDMLNNQNYNYFHLKNITWNQMKKDKIIARNLQQEKNGFDRTIKSNTLESFKQYFKVKTN